MANRGNWGDVATGIFGNLISAAAAQSVLSGRRKRENKLMALFERGGANSLNKRQQNFLIKQVKNNPLLSAVRKKLLVEVEN